LHSLKYIITSTGLDPMKFVHDWAVYELGITTWLDSRHLEGLVLEVRSALGSLVTRCDFTIDYSYGSGEGSMWVDTEALKYAIAKFGTIPHNCNYSVIVQTKAGRPSVAGWGPASLLPTTGFVKQSLGTTIGTSYLGAQASYYRKS